MADAKFRIILEGDDRDALRDIDNVVKGLNRIKDSRNRMSMERQKIARQERNERFNALRDDEKREKLLNRQIILERQLQRARSQNNLNRVSALELRHAQNRQQLRGIGSGGGGGGAGIGVGAVLSKFAPGVAAAVSIAGISRSLSMAVVNAVRFADELGDAADIIGITKTQALQITKAAGFAGVSSQKVFGGLSSLSAARSAALSGDENAQGLFKRYNADPNEDNLLKLGQVIIRAMGSGGMTPKDRGPMGQLFGRRPEGTIATLSTIGDVSETTKQSLQTLEDVAKRYEQTMSKWKLITVDASAALFDTFAAITRHVSNYQSWWSRSWLNKFSKEGFENQGYGAPQRSWADKRRLEDTLPNARNVNESIGMKGGGFAIPQADSLARMGLFVGGSGAAGQNIMKQQLMELKAIKDATRNNTRAIDSALQ